MNYKKLQYLPGAILLALGSIPLLAQVSIPNTFQAGETASADEVNANFQALQAALDDALQRIETLESDHVAGLGDHVEVIADPHYPNDHTVRFSAVNVQIVNGTGSTDGATNGLGNLILGYNEDRSGPETCTRGRNHNSGSADPAARCESWNGEWAESFKSGSHNLVAGMGNAYSGYGGVVLGENNAATGELTSVLGGQNNVAAGESSVIIGGRNNEIAGFKPVADSSTGRDSAIVGGNGNRVEQAYTVAILGGNGNVATDADRTSGNNGAYESSIVGGASNTVTARFSVAVGGWNNTVSGQHAVVLGGGQLNEASGDQSVVLGGDRNNATGDGEIAP